MSIKALSDYTVYAKYAKYIPEQKRRETWKEQVDRVFEMHEHKYQLQLASNSEFKELFYQAKQAVMKKQVLGSQRALQFGGPSIERHNDKMYNCFSGDTKLITSTGVMQFDDYTPGDQISVLTHNGRWKSAVVNQYGKQQLYKLTFKNGQNIHTVKCTRDHKWILKNGNETTNINIGDKILTSKTTFTFDYDNATPIERLYWCYGYVFGDGTTVKTDSGTYSSARLCGDDAKYEYRFTEQGFKSSSSASLNGDVIVYTGKYDKTAPDPKRDSIELIQAFTRGYLDADGSKSSNVRKGDMTKPNPFNMISAEDFEHQQFIETCFPIAGVFIKKVYDKTGTKTNLGTIKNGKTYSIQTTFDRENKHAKSFKLIDIEKLHIDNVWCVSVEDDKSFTMPNGMVTGNCATTYIDRHTVFGEIMYMLLCGCGVGFSVQYKHINQLPKIQKRNGNTEKFIIDDSIEGWADSISALVNSYFVSKGKFSAFNGKKIEFDYSLIRPEGAFISGGFKAPGPNGLRKAHEKIAAIIEKRLSENSNKLKPINAYDIIMHTADAVLSGGVRRSATACVFSYDDKEMITAKTGNWFYDNPQRGRSNNSALLIRNKTTFEQFQEIMISVKECGEPGFVFADNEDIVFNPCFEIGMRPKLNDGRSGVQYCNLTETNGKKCTTKEEFFHASEMAAILGTLQAGYTDFKYLGEVTEKIVRHEALLGCSITGMMDNPDILFSPANQRKAAEIIKDTNRKVAKMIGINPAARTTCCKPAGTTSCVLGTASGIHPHHAKRYIRRVQANRLEFPLRKFTEVNPLAVNESVWSENKTDMVISFLCEVPAGAVTKNMMSALDLLDKVKTTQQNWVEYGTNKELCIDNTLRHNVSNTITVQPDEWDQVTKYIYRNRQWFAAISLLPASGDKDYPQAPFTTVHTPIEMAKEYGDASVLASGVIVDGLKAFDDLWPACDAALGKGAPLPELPKEPKYPTKRDNKDLAQYFNDKEAYETILLKHDWVRRARQFADRYLDGDVQKMTYCLKDVNNWKTWCDLRREYKEVDWSTVVEDEPFYIDINTTAAQACQGGKCEL